MQDVSRLTAWLKGTDIGLLELRTPQGTLRLERRGDEPGVYILGSDITEFKALQSQLEHEAAHDPLTGLPNRRAFTLRLSRELERVRQNAEPLGLLFLDLDGFKGINDRLGHHVGDALLQRFAQVLSAEVRSPK